MIEDPPYTGMIISYRTDSLKQFKGGDLDALEEIWISWSFIREGGEVIL